MSFKEELKQRKEYFRKQYSKEEILKTFQFMLKRMEKANEIKGELAGIKITQIEGETITVEAKTKGSNQIRIYKVNLAFDQMENEEFSREAKIASPKRKGEIVELKSGASNEEKEGYYEETIDIWDEQEEREKRIETIQKTNYFIEKYPKETILKIADIMIKNSFTSGEIQGELQERKIAKIEDMTVVVAIKTKEKEEIKIYRLNLDFNQMKNMTYRKEAKVNSPVRAKTVIELKGNISSKEKESYYDTIPDFWDVTAKEMKEKE